MRHQVSDRVEATDSPVIVKTKALIAASGRSDVVSLAQGIVHWPPPPAALQVRPGSWDESPAAHLTPAWAYLQVVWQPAC